MQKEFIPYEQALALKELGFVEPCLGYYFGKDREVYVSNEYVMAPFNPDLDSKVMFRAPTYSQAFRWFREKCKLFYSIERESAQEYFCNYSIKEFDGIKNIDHRGNGYKYEEEAELACLIKLIEIVKNK
jgi:hypothetical protein